MSPQKFMHFMSWPLKYTQMRPVDYSRGAEYKGMDRVRKSAPGLGGDSQRGRV